MNVKQHLGEPVPNAWFGIMRYVGRSFRQLNCFLQRNLAKLRGLKRENNCEITIYGLTYGSPAALTRASGPYILKLTRTGLTV